MKLKKYRINKRKTTNHKITTKKDLFNRFVWFRFYLIRTRIPSRLNVIKIFSKTISIIIIRIIIHHHHNNKHNQ